MKARSLSIIRKGFTLIEILVVIAIISLLTGISYAVFNKAGATSETSLCTTNLRNLNDWGREFASQNGGKLPSSGMKDPLISKRECRNWWDALAPIVNAEQKELLSKDPKVPHELPNAFRCKADKGLNVANPDLSTQPATADTISYTSWLDNTKGRPMNVARGSALHGKPWLSDGDPIDGRSVVTKEDYDAIITNAVLDRHLGSIMVLYADGQIKKVEDATYEKIKQQTK